MLKKLSKHLQHSLRAFMHPPPAPQLALAFDAFDSAPSSSSSASSGAEEARSSSSPMDYMNNFLQQKQQQQQQQQSYLSRQRRQLDDTSTFFNTQQHHQHHPLLESLLQGMWLMAVPKSKVSPSRKRQKWLQHVPDPVAWYKCTRCGEPKRPHRICSKNVEICALSEEDYAARMDKKGASDEQQQQQ